MSEQIQVALLGCAHIHTPGFVKRLQDRQDVKVSYVWDHDEARAAKWTDVLGAQQVTDPAVAWEASFRLDMSIGANLRISLSSSRSIKVALVRLPVCATATVIRDHWRIGLHLNGCG